ncbi:hypothetical protein PV721_08115 [Streptomyces sp. MB09-01]|uniref:hypothetical protein n=1 Tax=Streptomyces sp. MB09-01 TaxID=3028666 RepID=UPI0029B7C8F7|nr:hypothetical protein [Streptomyces sp. MB09-01]MDX3534334.1 hypothetical protein [Streptomyces sp. MB09-01]
MMDDHTQPGGASEEEALRGLLHGAVEGLQPSAGALERLRHAVPARRARKRQALVGAAAVALLAGTAIPALMHLAGREGTATDHAAMAGHGEHTGDKPGAVGSDPHQNGSGNQPRSNRSSGSAPAVGGATGQPDATLGGSPVGGLTAGPSGTGSAGASAGTTGSVAGTGPLPPVAAPGVPGCGVDQLGVVGSARAPETDGKVYGSFRVTNVSAQGCAVTGQDAVSAAPAAGASAGQGSSVAVVGHTAGDPASGLLPDPSAEAQVLVLPPNTAYEVRFAWVPSGEACTPTNPDAGGKPPQTDSAGSSGAPAQGAATEPQTGAPPVTSGVSVSHTPQPGSSTTRTTLPEACGGTVYRTGAIPVEK